MKIQNLDIESLLSLYKKDPSQLLVILEEIKKNINDFPDPAIWISRFSWEQIFSRAQDLIAKATTHGSIQSFPLFGIPFAVKDNIDVLGLSTTAACPGFSYSPTESAQAITLLEKAGAIVIGKTNMDQFATGLVGTRSPYGKVKNIFNPEYISGGSSSGSAIAVAGGLVCFALGTDTAGSGRIPAGFNNIVGLKPSRGLISSRGLLPACRSLDCISIFALTAKDAEKVLSQIAKPDAADPFSRIAPIELSPTNNSIPSKNPSNAISSFKFGVPSTLEFFGDQKYAEQFQKAIEVLISMGGNPVPIDFTVFKEAAQLLYQGPWIAERQAAFGGFVHENPNEVLPIIREIVSKAKTISAEQAFQGYYQLKKLRLAADPILSAVDFLCVPTAPTHYTIAQIEADPILLNTRLGTYTNFANLLDLSAIAVPASFTHSHLPFGVTFITKAFGEAALLSFANQFQIKTQLFLGSNRNHFLPQSLNDSQSQTTSPTISYRLAVAGLHLSDQPLNKQLTDLDAKLFGTFKTAPVYRLYVIEKPDRKIPGLIRQAENSEGFKIEVEVWEFTAEGLGKFMKLVREPLAIGTLELENGEKVLGFLCEPYVIPTAKEISQFGGWRGYLASRS